MSGFSNLPSVFAIRRVIYGFIDLVYEKNGKTGEHLITPPLTSSQQCVVYNNRMYIFGGRSDSDQVFMYDMLDNLLFRLNVVGTPPKIRLYHNMSLDKSRKCFYLFGGVSTKNSSTYYGDLFKFDLERYAWSEITPTIQRDESIQHEWLSSRFPENYNYVSSIDSRSGHVGVYRDREDCLVIFAGLKNGQKTSDINVFSFTEQSWYLYKPYNDSIVSPRSYCNGQYCPGTDELVVFGGDTPASLTGDTFILNFTTHLWTKLLVQDPNDTLHTFPKVFGHTSILLDIKELGHVLIELELNFQSSIVAAWDFLETHYFYMEEETNTIKNLTNFIPWD
ncbi:hypothetical protein C9374_004964 [Naegleria lovaniensis]|uniref:Uncharacterized protein n=1 Tax=Naegleria lovaniensis TaxID=51637 RepID=A0AA88KJ79_NAELO|nr:uncharacterized protein C9374_004964 [Naegleria lovaniensis]KAG2382997.1 hypothetical protein C9374_004964 [Naegleria lovaniensis]